MKKIATVFLIFFICFSSCKKVTNTTKVTFEFAVYNDEPVFVDEYLYEKTSKNSIEFIENKLKWYLIDWNGNGIYNEKGIDYYGVKSPFKKRPIIAVLEETNLLNHNGITYAIHESTNYEELQKTAYKPLNTMSYISDFMPIALTNGSTIDSTILKGYDKTVIYFWATWCAPCIEKLEAVKQHKEELALKKINFVPICYGCAYDEIIALNERKELEVEPIEVTRNSALMYQLAGLPETYVFDKNGELVAEKFTLE